MPFSELSSTYHINNRRKKTSALGFPVGLFLWFPFIIQTTMNSLILCSLWILLFCQWVWVSHCFIVPPIGSFGRVSHNSKREVHAVFNAFPRNRGFERSGNVEPQGVMKHRDNSWKEYEVMVEQLRNYDDAQFHQTLTKLCTDVEFKNFAFWHKKKDLIEIFRKWNTHEHSKEEILHVLKAASNLFSIQDATEKLLLNELIRSYLNENKKSSSYLPQFLMLPLRKLGFVKDQKKSPSDFAMFLTALRKMKFYWKSMDGELKQDLLNTLNAVISSIGMDERSYAEILLGLEISGIQWRELPEQTGKQLVAVFNEMNDRWNGSSSFKAMNSFRVMGMNELKLDHDNKMTIFLRALAELQQSANWAEVWFHFLFLFRFSYSICTALGII
jgi:hypothetical protein